MKIYIIAGTIFGLIGLGFIISSIFTIKDLIHFNTQAEDSVGTVLRIDTRAESSSSPGSRAVTYSDYAIIEFTTDNGSTHIIEKLVYPGQDIAIGDELPLRYLPKNLSNVVLDSFWDQYGWLIISLIFGIGFTIGGSFSIWEGVKVRVNERRAHNHQEKIETPT